MTDDGARGAAATDRRRLLRCLTQIEQERGSGVVSLTGGSLDVTNLAKVYFPQTGTTKGDVMRYYVRASPYLLPVLNGRPLVLKRYPEGVAAPPFFQQKPPDEVPEAVITATLPADGGPARRIIGGELFTLLYCVQLGAIECDPWHSRLEALEYPDYTIIDLDPGPRASFPRVIQVARWLRDELDSAGLSAGLKTSGKRGIHAYIPLPAGTPNEAGRLVAEILARRVAQGHPKQATVRRAVRERPTGTVYVDYMQNVVGKSVAAALSVRARDVPALSAPLDWTELEDDLDPRDFTIAISDGELAKRGRMWRDAMKSRNSLERLLTEGVHSHG